jgi:hypothetical protein
MCIATHFHVCFEFVQRPNFSIAFQALNVLYHLVEHGSDEIAEDIIGSQTFLRKFTKLAVDEAATKKALEVRLGGKKEVTICHLDVRNKATELVKLMDQRQVRQHSSTGSDRCDSIVVLVVIGATAW